MSALGAARRRRRSSWTAVGSARFRASSTATRIAAFAGDRVDEFSLRAGGATYEELHAAGGGILSTVRATRAAGDEGSRRRSSATAAGCCAPARRPSRGSPATGSTGRPSSASLRAVRAAGGVPTWLGAHAVPPEHADADSYLDFVLADVLPDAARLAEAADVFLERGAFDAVQARRYLEACREQGLALRLHGDQFTEAGAIPLAIELGARSVDHLEATGPDGVAALAASDVTGVLLPASALFLDRPMPPARALVDARRRRRARDGLQSRQRLLREPAARLLARRHAAAPEPGRSARRLHGQRRSRPRPRRHAGANRARDTPPT